MEQINKQTNINDFLDGLIAQQPKRKTPKPATSRVTKETRRESYEKTKTTPLKQQVLSVLAGKELTAREIAIEMYKKGYIPYPARAVIQPRVTELVEAGLIEAACKKYDTETGRKVAAYKVVEK